MADKLLIQAELRTDFGKGASRRTRRENKIPAVIYGHGDDPKHVLLPGHETSLAVRNPNAIITLSIDGDEQTVYPKDIQRHPIKPFLVHLDLLSVRKGERIVVDIPVEVIGEPAQGFEFMLDQPTVAIEADALNLPDSVSIDITDRDENALPELLSVPSGSELALTDLESPVVSIYEPQEQPVEPELPEDEQAGDTAEDADAEDAEGESEEEKTEGSED